jgi:hypothetical protein
MQHSDILGQWELTRNIKDKLNDKTFNLIGISIFTENNASYVCNETGIIKSDNFQSKAHQTYNWLLKPKGWEISFLNGNFFHDLELVMCDQQVYHKCNNDIYRGLFKLNLPTDFSVTWNVSGPRKDYQSQSYYIRK